MCDAKRIPVVYSGHNLEDKIKKKIFRPYAFFHISWKQMEASTGVNTTFIEAVYASSMEAHGSFRGSSGSLRGRLDG